jgi:hypothetical protein
MDKQKEIDLILEGIASLESRGDITEADKIERQLNLTKCLLKVLDRRTR